MTKKKPLIAMAGLVTAVFISGTWAYWNQTATVDNPFDTGKFGNTVVEDFKPDEGENWQPGAEVNKDVLVQNTGDQDIIVRAKLDETWTRKGEDTPYKENASATAAGAKGPVYTLLQADDGDPDKDEYRDGLTADDQSVVTKTFSDSTNWIDGGDGWYYYKTNVAGGASTDKWLDSVELKYNIDMGKQEKRWFVTIAEDITTDPDAVTWVEYDGATEKMPAYLDATGASCAADAEGAQPVRHNKVEVNYAKDDAGNDLLGYGQSDYVLKVTVQTVQATTEAVDAVFGGGAAFTAPAESSWVLG